MKKLLCMLFGWVAVASAMAALPIVSDSTLRVSILTCSPGPQVYELYGHTALRVQSARRHTDDVYNYGVFDFRAPHFVWRFVMGETDYVVLSVPFTYFMEEYARRGSSVTEQVLNLKPHEAERLVNALRQNIRPENRVYRYNFLTNNCTTKVRDIVEENIDGKLVFAYADHHTSYRRMLHEFTAGHPWAREGNDLLLGSAMDTVITQRDAHFSPIYLMNDAATAMIAYRSAYRPLVSSTQTILQKDEQAARAYADTVPSVPVTPLGVSVAAVLLAAGLAVWEQRRGRICWPADAVLMFIQGAAGVLVTIMVCWSTHPGVSSNWQIIVLNPIPLAALPFVVRSDMRREVCPYHAFAAATLLIFLLIAPLMRQQFSLLIYPSAFVMLTRAASHIRLYRRLL